MISRIGRRVGRRYTRTLRKLLRATFPFWERLGVHIVPNDYEQPIPDSRALPQRLWTRRSDMVGVNVREEDQLQLLSLFSSRYKQEYDAFPRERPASGHQYFIGNASFDAVDGEILYCMIRHFKPRRIVEIGSGCSTYCSAQACLTNEEQEARPCELVAVDPYPRPVVSRGFPGLSQLMAVPVEQVPLSYFDELGENDILFIDSSHVLRIGNDVQYLYLEVLPRLNPGVIVHVHDVFLPAEYPKDWIMRKRQFWTEQYLLQAFLAFNRGFEVLWSGSYMHLKHPDKLRSAFASDQHSGSHPGSFWMRRTASTPPKPPAP